MLRSADVRRLSSTSNASLLFHIGDIKYQTLDLSAQSIELNWIIGQRISTCVYINAISCPYIVSALLVNASHAMQKSAAVDATYFQGHQHSLSML